MTTRPLATVSAHARLANGMVVAACAIAMTVLSLLSHQARAQTVGEELRIVAVVNDDVISAYDLSQRLRFVLVTAGIPINEQSMQRLAPQVLRTMIEEKVKRQEGARFGIEPDQNAVAGQISSFESRNNIPEGALPDALAQNGASIDPFVEQIEAEEVWRRTVAARYGAEVSVSDDEIDSVIEDLQTQAGQTEYRVAEIFVPADRNEPDEAQKTIARLVQELQNGAQFAALANSFSRAPSAESGGDLGYIQLEDLGSELAPVAAQLSPGTLSPPIETPLGYYLLLMVDTRKSPGLPTGTVSLTLSQFHIAVPVGADDGTVSAAMEQARQATLGVTGCEAFQDVAANAGSPLSGPLGTIDQSKLPPNIRDAVDTLDVGQPSVPVRTADGVSVLMVCARSGDTSIEQIRESIRKRLTNQRLGDLARQYLRDLKRSALVEIRQ